MTSFYLSTTPFCNSLFQTHLGKHWGSILLLEGTDCACSMGQSESSRERNPFSFSLLFFLIMNGDVEIAIKLCIFPRCFTHRKRECCDLEPQHLKNFNIKPRLWVWCVLKEDISLIRFGFPMKRMLLWCRAVVETCRALPFPLLNAESVTLSWHCLLK